MIFKIKGNDDCFIEGDNFTEIMYGWMHLTIREPEAIDDWKRGIARRIKIDSSAEIRTDSIYNFIRDLIQYGYLIPMNEHLAEDLISDSRTYH